MTESNSTIPTSEIDVRPTDAERRRDYVREWRRLNPDKVKAGQARSRNRPEIREKRRLQGRERQRRIREEEPERYKAQRLRAVELRAKKRAEAIGRPKPEGCDVCGATGVRIVLDHCHSTGRYRGWLCDGCNKALGLVQDVPERLHALAEYLERWLN